MYVPPSPCARCIFRLHSHLNSTTRMTQLCFHHYQNCHQNHSKSFLELLGHYTFAPLRTYLPIFPNLSHIFWTHKRAKMVESYRQNQEHSSKIPYAKGLCIWCAIDLTLASKSWRTRYARKACEVWDVWCAQYVLEVLKGLKWLWQTELCETVINKDYACMFLCLSFFLK